MDQDTKRFLNAYDNASTPDKARVAAITAILRAFDDPKLSRDQRLDLIGAALRFCETTYCCTMFAHINERTEAVECATTQDRVNIYAKETSDCHGSMIKLMQKWSDRFFLFWEAIDPTIKSRSAGGERKTFIPPRSSE